MLSKKQLEDALNCKSTYLKCDNKRDIDPYIDCVASKQDLAHTALEFRQMLEKTCVLLNDHFCGDRHYTCIGEMAEVEKVLKDAVALLKDGEGK